MASKYLQIAFGEGKFFEYAKEQKEGFVEHKNAKGESKGYRKYYDDIAGTLESIRVQPNDKLQGSPDELQISIKDAEGNFINVNMMLLDMNKDYSTFAESFLVHLPNLEKGGQYFIAPYNFKNEKDRTIAGLSIKKGNSKEGEKVIRLVQSAIFQDGTKREGDIPAVVWTLNERTGKQSPNSDAKFAYLKTVLNAGMERLKSEPKTDAPAPVAKKEEPKASAIQPDKSFEKVSPSSEEEDTLPF